MKGRGHLGSSTFPPKEVTFQPPYSLNCLVDLWVTARKLKRDWVEKKKIKSIWRRQKQKQGLYVQVEDAQQDEASVHSTEAREATDAELSGEDLDKHHSAISLTTSFTLPQALSPKARTNLRPSPPSQLDITHQVPERTSSNRERPQPFRGRQVDRRGKGSIKGKGRQPDMRMKMGKLLEKIKQDQ